MVYQSKAVSKLLLIWRSQPAVRYDLVERIANGQLKLGERLSPHEFSAGCSLILAQEPMDEAISKALLLLDEMAPARVNDDIFSAMTATAQLLELKGLRLLARKLLKLAKALAEAHRAEIWQKKLTKEIERKIVEAIRGEPFLSQRG